MPKKQPALPPRKSFANAILDVSSRHSTWSVFSDFLELAAITISNSVDLAQRDEREARYREIVKRYDPEDLKAFPVAFAELVNGFEVDGPHDLFGAVISDLERRKIYLTNSRMGQVFTPFHLSHMMAKMQFQDVRKMVEELGFVSASEPACGPGGMIAAMALAVQEEGLNYQQCLHVTGVDIDLRCTHMAYITASLLGIPAMIYCGDTLRLEMRSVWYTPMHVFGGWSDKIRMRMAVERANAELQKLAAEPPALLIAAE